MKRTFRFILIFVLAFTATIAINWWLDNMNYYSHGENDEFNVNVGDTFVFKLDSNGSTGYKNCFLAQTNAVKFIDNEYTPSLNSKFGYIGAGGITAYTFKAIRPGIDTIKVAYCPLAYENKSCEDYNDKNTKPDNVFIVNVSN